MHEEVKIFSEGGKNMITQNVRKQNKESEEKNKLESSVVYIQGKWRARMVCVIP